MSQEELKFADSVWHRVVQCVQEGMLMGTDVSDSLRQVRVIVDPSDPNSLVLSPAYQKQVRDMHEKLLQQARDLQAQQSGNKFIVTNDGDDGDSN